MSKQFTASGITSGVGSMLIGAKQEGFKILGNVEWRNYYNTGTFEKYFDAPYTTNYDEIEHLNHADICMVHCDCGDVSGLNMTGKPKASGMTCVDTLQAVKALQDTQPNFFAMDNLPKLCETFPADYWVEKFPEYDIYFEWISNHHYGNPQKNRKRFFVIGAKKEFKFVFHPGEFEQNLNMDDYLEIDGQMPLHEKVKGMSKVCDEHGSMVLTWQDVYDYRTSKEPTNMTRKKDTSVVTPGEGGAQVKREENLMYLSPDGQIKMKPGSRMNYQTYSMVITGGLTVFNHVNGLPLTIRERANIQGFPRDFDFLLKESELWTGKAFRQVGKAMPVQFTTYLTKQFHKALQGKKFKGATDERKIAPNDHINKIKLDYCEITHLPPEACESCWLRDQCDEVRS